MLRSLAKTFAGLTACLCAAAAAPLSPTFVPVFKQDFPDAFVLSNGAEFIAYSTNNGPNVPMATSSDLVHWSFVTDSSGHKRDALPQVGSWAKTGFTWAPEVLGLGERYLLYYTASDRKKNAQCVGVAVGNDPMGPFVDSSPQPIACQTSLGGTIDPDAFRAADGTLYLYFKNDGNRVHARTSLWGQRLAPDGLSVTGQPVELIRDNQPWEQWVVEAPSMVLSPTGYQLFFSGGFFGWNPQEGGLSPYAMGYASCASPLGPCTASKDNPILHSFKDREAGCLSGPGHQSIFTVGTRSFISFHAWAADSHCRKADDARYLYIAPIFWRDGKPVLGPSLREQASAERG